MADNNDLGFSIQQSDVNFAELFANNNGEIQKPAETQNAAGAENTENQNQNTPVVPGAVIEDTTALSQMLTEFFNNGAKPVEGEQNQNQDPSKLDPNSSTGGAAAAKPGETVVTASTNADGSIKSQTQIIYEHYKGKGMLAEVDGFDGSEEMMDAAIRKTIEDRLPESTTNHIKSVFNKLPAQAKIAEDFYNHLAMGGTVANFLTMNTDRSVDPAGLQSTDEATALQTAANITSLYLQDLGWKPEAIEKEITLRKAMGKDAFVEAAGTMYEQWSDSKKAQRDQEAVRLKTQNEQAQSQLTERNQKIITEIDSKDEFMGVKINTPALKKAMKDFIFLPTEDDGRGGKISKFVQHARTKASSPEYILNQAAYFMGGGPAGIQNAATTAATTKVLSKLEEQLASANNPQNRAATQGSSSTPIDTADKQKISKEVQEAYF